MLPLTPEISDEELEQLARKMATSNPTDDPITAFEEAVRAYTHSQYAISISSASVGMHLAIRAAGVRAGDLVITTPFSSLNAVSAVLDEGAVPVFVDIEPRTGNIDPYLVFAAAQDIMQGGRSALAWMPPEGAAENAPLKAILPVDGFGQTADLELILNTAWKYKLKVIEDASTALGAEYKGHPAGTLGDYGIISSNPHVAATSNEAALVITDDADAANLLRSLRDQAEADGDSGRRKGRQAPSHNLDAHTALRGLIQVQRLDEMITKRQLVAGWYNLRLKDVMGVELPKVAAYSSRMSWCGYVVRLAPGLDRDELIRRMAKGGFHSQAEFLPIHLQPHIQDRFGYQEGSFPVTEDLCSRCLALPFSGRMTEAQVDTVCKALQDKIEAG